MDDHTYIRDISWSRISDAEEAGGKGANMGELVAAELPLCYRDSMREGDVDEELSRFHREALAADMTHLPELSKGRRVSAKRVGIGRNDSRSRDTRVLPCI